MKLWKYVNVTSKWFLPKVKKTLHYDIDHIGKYNTCISAIIELFKNYGV